MVGKAFPDATLSIAFATEDRNADMPPNPPDAPPPAASRLSANATLLLVLTTLFWGGNAIAGKFAVGHVSPMVLTALRWLIAAAILFIVAHRHVARDWPVIRAHLGYLFLLGAFGFAVFNATLYSALKFTTAINVTILQAAMPMFIFLLNFAAFRTHVHWAQIVGYTVTLTGVVLTASAGDPVQILGLTLNKGDLLMLAGSLIYATYSVALRARPPIHWLSFLTVLVAAAAIASLGLAAYEIADGSAIWPTTPTAWAVIAYTIVFPSLLGQAFFARGVELIGSNRAGLFLNLVPIFGSLLAVLILGERFELYHALALALVIGGIWLAQNLTPR
jgi:drug/metabolite transporter (DMT)-like permease